MKQSRPFILLLLFLAAFAAFILLGGLFLIEGCAAHKPVANDRILIPNECIHSIEKTPETYCEKSPSGELHCYKAGVTRIVGCEKVEVDQKGGKKK